MTPLTDAELSELRNRFPTHFAEPALSVLVQRAVSELLAARALLATPMPKTYDDYYGKWQPFVTSPGSDGLVGVASRLLVDDLLPDEAIALGAALIRTALAARGGVL